MSTIFAKNLRMYRSIARMTQADLAKASGITRAVVNNYELARSEPSFETLCKMATVLGVDITDLVEDKGPSPDYIRRVLVTDEESALLQAYREADPIYRTVALDILRDHQRRT